MQTPQSRGHHSLAVLLLTDIIRLFGAPAFASDGRLTRSTSTRLIQPDWLKDPICLYLSMIHWILGSCPLVRGWGLRLGVCGGCGRFAHVMAELWVAYY